MDEKIIGITLILISTGLEAIGQLALKKAATIQIKIRYIWFLMGGMVLFAEFFTWTGVLHYVDLSIANPMGSLSYIFVFLLSYFFLRESSSKERGFGLGCICIGAIMLGVSGYD
jgi:drug/metabolite transporter (DMT)-like permease